jgi:hypothetical protein
MCIEFFANSFIRVAAGLRLQALVVRIRLKGIARVSASGERPVATADDETLDYPSGAVVGDLPMAAFKSTFGFSPLPETRCDGRANC